MGRNTIEKILKRSSRGRTRLSGVHSHRTTPDDAIELLSSKTQFPWSMWVRDLGGISEAHQQNFSVKYPERI